jgi:hypothetical protein
MVTEPLKWYDENADNPLWVKTLAEVRHRATREGCATPTSMPVILTTDEERDILGTRRGGCKDPCRMTRSRSLPEARIAT